MNIAPIQSYLVEHGLDGWLLADFHGRNTIALTTLGLGAMLTRRAFYLIPATGEPIALVNPVEASKFAALPGRHIRYTGYKGLEQELGKLLKPGLRLAMEYSPKGRLPYIGLVDAGTIELVREYGVEIVSSADLVANFQARLSPDQITAHRTAARHLIEIVDAAFALISDHLKTGRRITEYDVCQFILARFEALGMMTEFNPNCSVGPHAGDNHYEPTAAHCVAIERGQIVLIDLWAKLKTPGAAYADITWMAFAGAKAEIPKRYNEVFVAVIAARDAAVTYLHEHLGQGPVYGAAVDDACRAVLQKAGYGANFTHRTGHSIAINEHGPGPNIDNLETEDHRELQPGHLFSIEPGAYFDDCGFRSEINCLITPTGCDVTTLPLQTEIRPLL
jgi:Xaa-Pro aminopeptidase